MKGTCPLGQVPLFVPYLFISAADSGGNRWATGRGAWCSSGRRGGRAGHEDDGGLRPDAHFAAAPLLH